MLRTWLRRCRRRLARPNNQPAASRPAVELLEDRRLLTAGTLDPFFGFLGKSVTPDLASAADAASATAFQPDGKLLVAGTSVYGSAADPVESGFALARYNTNGTLDWGFGLGGRTSAYFGENLTGPAAFSLSQADAIAVQPDGKILVVGSQSSFAPNYALARFNANGTLDTTFGVGGEEITYFPNFSAATTSSATSIALLPGGGFLVAGQVGFGGGSAFALAEYNADGSLNTSFGSGGEVTTQVLPGATEGANAITVQSNGAIVVAGWVQPSSTSAEFALVRYTPNGTLDTSFNGTGKVITSLGGKEYAFAVTTTAGGKIRVAGDSAGSTGAQTVALAQYNIADGSLDTTFGTGGTVTAPFAFVFPENGGAVSGGAGVSFTPTGGVVVVGAATTASGSNFGAERYTANGAVDTTFGSGGTVTTDFGGTDVATAVAVKSDGTLAVAGDTSSNNGDFAVARYRSNGSPLTSFGGGRVTTNFYFSTVAPTDPVFSPATSGFTAVLPDGDLLVAGTIAPDGVDGEFVLAKYTSFGTPDLTFGNLGTVVTSFGGSASAAGIAIAPNGTIYVVGSAINSSTGVGDIAVAAYNADGSADTAFNGTGTLLVDFNGQNSTGSGVAVDANANLVVVGTTTDPNTFDQDFAVARVTPTGALDPTFGTGGEVFTDFGGAQAAGVALSGGQILVGGTALGEMAVARYNSDGSQDGTFGSGGLAMAAFAFGSTGSSIALAPNGQIVLGGSTPDPVTFNNDFALARFNSDGSTDTTFGGGTGETSFTIDGGFDNGASVVVQANGKILIAGTATPAFNPNDPTTANSDFALVRVNTDGTLDSTFGTGGIVTTSFGSDAAAAASVVLTPTGNIIVGGSVYGNGGGALALACYLGDSGDPFNF